ncbi:unnamed protein product (macronuclear) [Paramecium tetraurelia]|uniref:Transmembrane protein n=1 Tax=Paramecium tetraurelia TaxID=5888 RepID=A0BDZ1_PARTE|nr:uncharacterized protein GSPATT00027789001 [Paramecium tetraurelia]CAK56758.1 unnamed protein product [Paramecium tetraurelia]|eukprot:XP_001424156.1 hypothetical protein (macronuclear) [Paramecium tetraurelia strain d4-2]
MQTFPKKIQNSYCQIQVLFVIAHLINILDNHANLMIINILYKLQLFLFPLPIWGLTLARVFLHKFLLIYRFIKMEIRLVETIFPIAMMFPTITQVNTINYLQDDQNIVNICHPPDYIDFFDDSPTSQKPIIKFHNTLDQVQLNPLDEFEFLLELDERIIIFQAGIFYYQQCQFTEIQRIS